MFGDNRYLQGQDILEYLNPILYRKRGLPMNVGIPLLRNNIFKLKRRCLHCSIHLHMVVVNCCKYVDAPSVCL